MPTVPHVRSFVAPRGRLAAWRAALTLTLAAAPLAAGPAAPDAGRTASDFYGVLVTAMKQGPQLGFEGRRRLLDPEIRRDFNLPLMTRIVVGLTWRTLSEGRQQALVTAFSDFTVASYASEFKEFGGERFVVEPGATPLPSGDVIVHTRLLTTDGKTVQLDYLMRAAAGRWQIIDVYLTGTISELAARRSEFSTVLRQGGIDALLKLMRDKTAKLSG